MSQQPLVTVLMPVYNGELFLKESIESILNQSFDNFEFLIIDDGSTDKTSDIVSSFSDSRIQYIKNEENLKIIETLNKGLLLSNGKYIVRMDADDIALPGRIEKQVLYMEQNPTVVLCGTSINRFSNQYSIMDLRGGDDAIVRAKMLFDTAVNHPSAIIRKKILDDNHLGYPSQYLHTEDYALWYELSLHGDIVNLDEVLLRYRMHGSNLSMQHNELQYQNMNRMRIRIMDDFLSKSKVEDKKAIMDEYGDLLSLSEISIKEMKSMDDLLMKIVTINRKSNVYSDKGIASAASWFWYVVFTHENCTKFTWKMLSLFLWNKKSICHFLDRTYRKKLLVKSLLMWRKK